MLSLDECMKFVKGMAIACTAVGDVNAGERYNDILYYLEELKKIEDGGNKFIQFVHDKQDS